MLRRFLPSPVTLWFVLSGALLALAFPRPDLAGLAWVGLVPLLLVMERRPFKSGFIAGVTFFALVLYWLNIVMVTFGHLDPVFSVAAYLLLVAYLALFFGAATWAACRLKASSGLAVSLTLPVLWVALEFLRGQLLSGFPWASLGYSQQSHLALIQSVDLFGIHGLGFILVLINALLAQTATALWRRSPRNLPRLGAVLGLALVLGNYGYGWWRLGQDLDGRKQTLATTLVQGNIDQGIKWNPAFQQSTVVRYRDLSLAATHTGRQDLVIWPESATPFYFQDGGALAAEVEAVAKNSGAFLLFGSPAYEKSHQQYRFLNSAFLLSPQGLILGRSDKVHLVPFGEYVPLARLLPFVGKLVEGVGDFSPGIVSPLSFDGTRIGVLVCYEGIFPELARDLVQKGSNLLVNVTNDAWYGRSSAPYQHLAMARFRAIENRVWLARAANTGISAFIAPSGRITAASPIFETRFLQGIVGLGAAPTLYTRTGDVLPLGFVLLAIFWLVRTRQRPPVKG